MTYMYQSIDPMMMYNTHARRETFYISTVGLDCTAKYLSCRSLCNLGEFHSDDCFGDNVCSNKMFMRTRESFHRARCDRSRAQDIERGFEPLRTPLYHVGICRNRTGESAGKLSYDE